MKKVPNTLFKISLLCLVMSLMLSMSACVAKDTDIHRNRQGQGMDSSETTTPDDVVASSDAEQENENGVKILSIVALGFGFVSVAANVALLMLIQKYTERADSKNMKELEKLYSMQREILMSIDTLQDRIQEVRAIAKSGSPSVDRVIQPGVSSYIAPQKSFEQPISNSINNNDFFSQKPVAKEPQIVGYLTYRVTSSRRVEWDKIVKTKPSGKIRMPVYEDNTIGFESDNRRIIDGDLIEAGVDQVFEVLYRGAILRTAQNMEMTVPSTIGKKAKLSEDGTTISMRGSLVF